MIWCSLKTVTLNQLVGPSLLGCDATLYFKYLLLLEEVYSVKSLPMRPTMDILAKLLLLAEA